MSSTFRSPLHEMACTTPTDFWCDSCAVAELKYAIEHGAVGATSNPTIIAGVLRTEFGDWKARVEELIQAQPTWTEAHIAWELIEEMSVKAAGLLEPVFEQTGGKKGWLSIQTNAEFNKSPHALVSQALHFASLAPNLQVKIPATAAGIQAIEDATAHGVNVNATVCFTAPQAVAVAESVERGLKRREADGHSTANMFPVCTIMVGRLDDWLKVVCEQQGKVPTPGTLDWAGIAVFKNALKIFKKSGYRTRLLAAAYRHHLHWSELVGGDVILTIPPEWQRRFNASTIPVIPRIDNPVPQRAMTELSEQFEDFRRAYDPRGMQVAEFDGFGATRRTLRTFLDSYYGLLGFIRDLRIPNPDK
ncbi:transaldolase family protein [Sorangium sp. So ce854]|uniref:transaldolase family protein n=1 Tax=Sorangium sp. So ce854 TaxID=3133322 RepID=UPI003F63E542